MQNTFGLAFHDERVLSIDIGYIYWLLVVLFCYHFHYDKSEETPNWVNVMDVYSHSLGEMLSIVYGYEEGWL